MTEKTVEWYQKELADRFAYFYYQTDGTFNFPNSAEGDLLKMTQKMLNLMKSDHQPTFEVGEYYSAGNIIYKVLEIEEYPYSSDVKMNILALSKGELNEETIEVGYPLEEDKPATAEQIATFKRTEHFAKHGRKLDEFRVGDVCVFENQVALVTDLEYESIYFYVAEYGSDYVDINNGLTLTLIQTAEELREVEE